MAGRVKLTIASNSRRKVVITSEDLAIAEDVMTVREDERYNISCEITTPFPIANVEIKVSY